MSHEASNPSNRTVLPQSNNLSISLNSVILQGSEWNILGTTLGLLWLGVNLLFTLLTSSAKAKYEVQSGFLLDVVVGKGTSVFQLLSSKDETLLIWRDSFLVLDLGFDIVNCVRWLNIKCDGLACEFESRLESKLSSNQQFAVSSYSIK